jgi:hypothetical protein
MSPDTAQFNSLGEQTRMVNIAAKYTGGDIEKARQMVAGQYNDVVAIKGKFSVNSAQKYGILILFVNVVHRYLMNANTLITGNRAGTEKARIFDHWKHYHSGFEEIAKREGEQTSGSYEFTSHLASSIDGYNVYPMLESADLDSVTSTISEIINKYFNSGDVECQVELEKTSSLALEVDGIQLEKRADQPAEQSAAEGENIPARFREIEQQADYVIEGKVIVSPVRGKSIQSLKPGETIKVQLVNKDDISLRVAEVLKAVTEEGDILPIKARMKVILPADEGGMVLYAYVAKNVLVKIVEEENVKIEVEIPAARSDEDESRSSLPLYIALLIGLVLFTVIVLSVIL